MLQGVLLVTKHYIFLRWRSRRRQSQINIRSLTSSLTYCLPDERIAAKHPKA
ncbi:MULTISPECIES: hypothetical protein [unclassified Tolypothrix]|uniref:hypothetical protein n=1 Tax=unclassified Tolypothrix TaxID=2649714 RepID=UPI0012D7BD29|nr:MULTISPECIES: hypothetical protein [unclassified Tolypothrix]MBE9086726.1 hypothetical protein [Tolypothrix sp. LEGE 11397]UYD28597.1 hypothetical protein HGR01_11485 [Tolypothrix sp. PCC 7712]UYD35493.1 hypothetical protein HG267_06890 [Tolypothrix sp. PCC 7601]